MLNQISNSAKFLLVAAFLFYASITLFGFNALYESPYTGLSLAPCKEKICVESVDSGSPASISGVRSGDVLAAVNGEEIRPIVFFKEPDHIRWKKDRVVFRHWRQRFDDTIGKGKPLGLVILRKDKNISVSLMPVSFSFRTALVRTLPVYVFAWASVVLALLVLRKKQDEVSWVNFAAWYVPGIAGITLTAYTVRDIAFSSVAMLSLSRINHLAMFFSVFVWIHFSLVFPRKRKILDAYPWMRGGLYTAAGLLTILDIARPFEDTFVLSYSAVGAGSAIVAFLLIYDLAKEQDLLYRKQIQWAVFGIAASVLSLLILHFIPLLLDLPAINDDSAYLLLAPAAAGFAFAITRYRLMDIENIFDYVVIYGVTIIVLECAELVFLSAAAPYLPQGRGSTLVSIAGVLLIVFLYIPVRSRLSAVVEKLFGRGEYDTQEELRMFAISIGSCDHTTALDKFAHYAGSLLSPTGIFVVAFRDSSAKVILAKGGGSGSAARAVSGCGDELVTHFLAHRSSAPGFALLDMGLLKGANVAFTLERALFVPVFSGNDAPFLMVLLKKTSGAAYSRKDRTLFDLIAVQLAHVLEAEDRRLQLERERMRLAREIHDGISSEFSGILAYGETGEHGLKNEPTVMESQELFSKIVASSRRGLRELRNIIWALNTERQTFRHLAAYTKRYASDFLDAGGIALSMPDEDGRDEVLLSHALSLTLFRIVQELCHNTLKYATAGRVTISLKRMDGLVHLTYEDNGKGFDYESARKAGGHGLRNIEKRVEEIGGTVTVSSSSDQGASVLVRLPIQ